MTTQATNALIHLPELGERESVILQGVLEQILPNYVNEYGASASDYCDRFVPLATRIVALTLSAVQEPVDEVQNRA